MASNQTQVDYLFGGDESWSQRDWISSDDRVRGGKSQSNLDCTSQSNPHRAAVFHGVLDITALGGAGFASQRTQDPRHWNLSNCQGLRLSLGPSDGKKYTLLLKDEVLPKRPDGREQSSISWEYDFAGEPGELFIPWSHFKPTYRGKPRPDAAPLDLSNIRRIGIMMRSFFGEQQGPFTLELNHIAALHVPPESRPETPESDLGKNQHPQTNASWRDLFCGLFRARA